MNDPSEDSRTPARDVFFKQLYRMITIASHTSCIDWLPDGKSFVIFSKQDFVDNVLALSFPNAKYSSFTRRLKRHGFRRQTETGAYYHPSFTRDMTFDLDLDCDYPPAKSDSPPAPSDKALPLKKRSKWTSPSSSPIEDRDHALGPQDSDVKFMPALMRAVSRQKRKERRDEDEDVTHPPAKKTFQYSTYTRSPNQSADAEFTPALMRTVSHHMRNEREGGIIYPSARSAFRGSALGGAITLGQSAFSATAPSQMHTIGRHERVTVKGASTIDQNVEAAQTLASLGQRQSQQSLRSSYYDRFAAREIEELRLRSQLASYRRQVQQMNLDNELRLRSLMANRQRQTNQSQRQPSSGASLSPSLNASKYERYRSLFEPGSGVRQLSDDARVPIGKPSHRNAPAFNRAA